MNHSRLNFIGEIQTLTKSEYASAKLIPNAVPLRRIEPEDEDFSRPIEPIPKMEAISSKRYMRENEEEAEIHSSKKRALVRSDVGGSPVDNRATSDQLQHYNRVIEAQAQEIEYFKEEIRRLQEEKILNVQNYEQRLVNYREQESYKYELERKVRILESEKATLEDDVNRCRLKVTNLEFELDQFRRQNATQHDLHSKIEELTREIHYYENQTKQARVIQISLEQELRQRADERALLISEYEIRITNLQNDLVLYRETRKIEDSDQNQALTRLQDENINVSNENKNLRSVARELQNQIDRIRDDHFQSEMNFKKRINEFENINSSSLLTAEKFKQQAENSNINKVLLMIEIDRLREEVTQLKSKESSSSSTTTAAYYISSPKPFEERSKRANMNKENQSEDIKEKLALETKSRNLEQMNAQHENKAILFMIEIERLGVIVQELQAENTVLRQKTVDLELNYQRQIDDFQQQYELVIRPQIEAEIRNTTDSIEREKKTLELEIYDHKSEIMKLRNEILSLQSEASKAKERNIEITLKLEETVSSYDKFIYQNNEAKRSLEEEFRLKYAQHQEGADLILLQERQGHQREVALYNERIRELENRISSLSVQINGLQRNLNDSEEEINNLKNTLLDAENERIYQLEQLRTTFKQTFENEMGLKVMQLEAMHASLEDQLKASKEEIMYLGEQNGILNRETEQLVVENTEKAALIEQYSLEIAHLKEQNQKHEQVQTEFIEEAKQRETHYEETLKEHIEHNLKQAHHNFGAEKASLEAELERLQQENEEIVNSQKIAFEQLEHGFNEERVSFQNQLDELEKENQIQREYLEDAKQREVYFEEAFNKRLETHLKELHLNFNNEKADLEAELQRVRDESEESLNHHKRVQQENEEIVNSQMQQLEQALTDERASLQLLEQQNQELQARLFENISQIEQLQKALVEINKQNQSLVLERDNLHADIEKMQVNLNAEIEKMQMNFETQIRQNIEFEIENVSVKYNQEKREIEDTLLRVQTEAEDLGVKAILYMAEIERLHTIIFEIEKEEDIWRERIVELENQNAIRLEEQKVEYEDILRDKLVSEIEKIQVKVQQEKSISEKELNLLRNKYKELQDSLSFSTQENSRLRNESIEKEDEMHRLSVRLSSMTHEQEEYVRGLKSGIQTQLRIEFENQIKDITGRFSNEKIAFEDQIRQLKNRISEIEVKLSIAQNQNEALSQNLEENYNEMEILRNRCFELEKEVVLSSQRESAKRASPQKERENASLRAQIEELENKNQEYFKDLALLTTEIERISRINLDLKGEAENLRIKAESLERRSQVEIDQTKIKLEMQFREERDNMSKDINARYLAEIKNYDVQTMDLRRKIIDYESDMSLLTNEIQRLSALLSDKNEELEVWKERTKRSEQSKNQELYEITQKRDFDQRVVLEQELRNLVDHFSIEKAQYDFKIKDLHQKNLDYENKIAAISAELDKFKSLYEETESIKRQLATNPEHPNFVEFEEMRIHLETLKRSSLQISDYEIRFQAERTAYEAQIMQYKHKIEELETVIVAITRESQRLSSHLRESGIEAQQHIRKQSGFIGMVDMEEHQKVQRENENLKKLLLENQEARVRFEVERTDYQSQVIQLKQIIEVNQIEMKKLYGLLESRKAENEALYHDLNKTREEMTKNLREFKGMEAEYNLSLHRNKNVNKEIEDLRNARDMYRSQLEKNEIELTLKNKELLEKICQIDVLKIKYEEAIANVDPITSTIITRISTTRQEI